MFVILLAKILPLMLVLLFAMGEVVEAKRTGKPNGRSGAGTRIYKALENPGL